MSQTATAPTTAPAKLPPALFGHWIHSREEDRNDVAVYRPRGFAFPPAFGRDGFEIRPDGRFVQFDPGPADGIVKTPGHWSALGAHTIAVSFGAAERDDYTFTIVAVDAEVLRIRLHTGKQTGAADEELLRQFATLPPATSARRIDFEKAEILTLESFPPQYVLAVSGVKPYLNMAVDLVPVVYVRQPEFWEIEVVGRLRGIGLPALARYSVTLPLAGVTGTHGVEVVGATRGERLAVPPGQPGPDEQ